MQEQIGYLLGNIKRKQVLETLDSRGKLNKVAIAHLVRLPPRMAEKILEDLKNRKLIEQAGDNYKLTDDGKDVLKKVKGF